MEIEQLKARWTAHNDALAKSLRLNEVLLAQSNLRRAESALARLRRGIVVELALTLAVVVFAGWFGAGNPQPRFLVPAALIDLYAVGLVVAHARALLALKNVDFDEPVVAIQRRLEAVRLLRIRTTLGALLFAPLMWLPIFIVAVRVLFKADVYAAASPAWLAANVLFGLAVIPIAIGLARRLGRQMATSSFGRRLADDIAGRSLAAARNDLDTIVRFAAE